MKKTVLSKLGLNAYRLSGEEKKQIIGGNDTEIYDPNDCTPRGCECVNGFIRCAWYNPLCSYPDVLVPCGNLS